MSEQIKVGDLVMVMRGNCSTKNIGKIFKVARIGKNMIGCVGCGKFHSPRGTPIATEANSLHGFEFFRLKRINPPAIDETRETDREVTA